MTLPASFLVLKMNGRPIWKSEKLIWNATSECSVLAAVQTPELFAMVDAELTADVRTADEILILQFAFGQEFKKNARLPQIFHLEIRCDGSVTLEHLEEPIH